MQPINTKQNTSKPNWILIFGGFTIIAIIIFVAMFARTFDGGKDIETLFEDSPVLNTGLDHTTGTAEQQGGVPRITADDHARGAQDPSVIWIEYGDFECPFCKRYHEEVKQLLTAYPDDVQVVFRHFPLSSHKDAYAKAVASECAGALGGEEAFWQYHDMLYDRANASGLGISIGDLTLFAVELGISQDAFNSCMGSGEFDQRIQGDVATGSAAGVTGTPSTVIVAEDGRATLIPGVITFDVMQEIMTALGN